MIGVEKIDTQADSRRFGTAFPPASIAIVGTSRTGASEIPGYNGLQLFEGLRKYGYKGRLYPVNPKAREIMGEKAYPSVVAIPERLDLAIVTVPAPRVPDVIDDCAAAGTRYVHICTSGFGETGLPEGRRLEQMVLEKAVRGGLALIGPNCMGFSVPAARITAFPDIGVLPEGTVGFISQSGGHARTFMTNAPTMNLGLSTVVSYGNGLMLDAVDFTEYLAEDAGTEMICIYLEGIRDGGRLIQVVKRTTPLKPVILMKGGLTGPGAIAASSHTGSLAGSQCIWRGFYRQTGAMEVDTLEEMADTAMAFHLLSPFVGAATAVMTMGGGSTVQAGDMCGREGLNVPRYSRKTSEGLAGFISSVNQGLSNPMDIPGLMFDPSGFPRALRLIAADPNIDIILTGLPAEQMVQEGDAVMEEIAAFNQERPFGKQAVAAVTDNWGRYAVEEHCRRWRESGMAVFRSFAGACRVINQVAAYYRRIRFQADSR